MTAPATAAAPVLRTGSAAGFWQLLRAEWVKFRSVRGWVIGMIVAAVLAVLVGVFASGSASIGCGNGNGPQQTGRACLPTVPIGPGGEAVADSFFLVGQPLAGNGSIAVRVTSLTGAYGDGGQGTAAVGSGQAQQPVLTKGLEPWSKAGLIIKASTRQGSAYVAMMVTGSHGVRMQDNFTHDIPGLPGAVSAASPRWLRLTRSGGTVRGYDSTDGSHWSLVGTVRLSGLPATVQAGMFATSPPHVQLSPFFGGASIRTGSSQATAVFDHVSHTGDWPAAAWTGRVIGGGIRADIGTLGGQYHQAGRTFSVSGSGDIAPIEPGPGAGLPNSTIEQSLAGLFAGLIAVLVVAAMFVTTEYRRGLIRITLAANPRRGAVLLAKAAIAGAVAFVVGVAAAVTCVLVGVPRQRAEGLYILPVSALTEVRVLAGSAAMVAVAAVFAVALGAIFRRSAVAVTVAIVAIVLPFLLSVTVLPASAADWVLRLTPAAGFAIEQSIPHYPQVTASYAPAGGWYPLTPLAGFAVLCGYAAAALLLAIVLLRRRDA
jgi:ABC-type transport system involved in multi-copper enzyme maturation permease subunit